MDSEQLKAVQGPLKSAYQTDPSTAIAELRAGGRVDFGTLTCHLELPANNGQHIVAGLHPKAGGDGRAACSGDMLLQSLVACAGVTLAAVTTAMGLTISEAFVEAVGWMDFCGTLGVDRNAPIGLTSISLSFRLVSDEPAEKLDKLVQLTERYCVVMQTLKHSVAISATRT